VKATVSGDETRWTYDETDRAGRYEVAFGPPIRRTDAYAVNIDPAESDLTRVDATELPTELRVAVDQLAWADFAGSGGPSRSRLYATLLYVVLGLLLCESAAAWWFGYRSA
jgi:hypothetical protein